MPLHRRGLRDWCCRAAAVLCAVQLGVGGGAAQEVLTPAPVPASAPMMAAPVEAAPAKPLTGKGPTSAEPALTMAVFLDRLMIAESNGRLDARNPRSTALGPFQFIESTFLAVARRYFAAETENLSPQQILALRTDAAFSRRAAEAYTVENAAALKGNGVEPSYPNLRLAFLLGPSGAISVLKAPPEAPLSSILPAAVLVANPFMASMTARGLAVRSAREVNQPVDSRLGVDVPPGTAVPRLASGPRVVVKCNLKLPSCKRWLALHQAKARTNKPTARSIVAAAAAPAKAKVARPPSQLGATVKPKRR